MPKGLEHRLRIKSTSSCVRVCGKIVTHSVFDRIHFLLRVHNRFHLFIKYREGYNGVQYCPHISPNANKGINLKKWAISKILTYQNTYQKVPKNAFKNFFRLKISKIRRVLYLLLWLLSKIFWHLNYLLKIDNCNVSTVSKFEYAHPRVPLWCIWSRYTLFITIIM